MSSLADNSITLRDEVEKTAREGKARAVAVALLDVDSGFRFSLDDSLHVRNRFMSAADGSLFRLDPASDALPELYRAIGRTVKISALAEGMIAASSNLATNLLLDFVGVEYARNVLRDAQVSGVELRRGVEDHAAHQRDINNEVTADGLLTLLCALRGDFLSNQSRDRAIRILLMQRFKSMIPAGLPAHAAVAHKTGEISTACHDMGIVYLPERQPYILAILTEFDAERDGRRETVAAISEVIHRSLTITELKSK
jgi:beta-lactamase class A